MGALSSLERGRSSGMARRPGSGLDRFAIGRRPQEEPVEERTRTEQTGTEAGDGFSLAESGGALVVKLLDAIMQRTDLVPERKNFTLKLSDPIQQSARDRPAWNLANR